MVILVDKMAYMPYSNANSFGLILGGVYGATAKYFAYILLHVAYLYGNTYRSKI